MNVVISVLAYSESKYIYAIHVCLLIFLLYKRAAALYLICYSVLAALFPLYLIFNDPHPTQEQIHPQTNTFTFISEPKINGNVMRGFLKSDQNKRIYYMYELKSEKEKISFMERSMIGYQVKISGQFIQSEPAHRFSFNMENYLKSKQAAGTFEIETLKIVGFHSSIFQKLAQQRFNVKQHIEHTFPESLHAEAQALLIGLQEDVQEDVERAYQKLGITHLFAISGLHIALLSYLYYEAILRIGVRKELAYSSLIILLPIYAILAGGAPSVWRAVMVVLIAAVMKLFSSKWSIDDVLSVSAILYIVYSPYVIFQIGFQLSYMATFSIIYSHKIIQNASNLFIQNFYLTFVCQILTYPLLLLHFYELSLSSFFTNLIFVPLFSFVILPINLILFVFSYIVPKITDVLLNFYAPLRQLLGKLILWIAELPNQMWVAGKPSILALCILYTSVFLALVLLDRQKQFRHVVIVLVLPAIAFHFRYYFDQSLHVSFINVGQGDSILIELPRRKAVYLVDTGGLLRFESEQWKARNELYEVGRQVVVPYLKGKGISKIDQLIITHADADHVEGAEEVLREIRVDEIHITPNSIYNDAMSDLRAEAKKRNVPFKEKMGGESWTEVGIKFSYLWPKDLHYEGNNDSLVLLLQTNLFKLLLTGDLEKEGEQEIVKHYPQLLANVDVLKAGHHGSKTSSSEIFLKHTKPRLTIFTAGKNNRYNHPAKEVIERMERLNLPYKITGIEGTIELIIDAENMYIK